MKEKDTKHRVLWLIKYLYKNTDDKVKVSVSGTFFGWVCRFGDKMGIAAPEQVSLEYDEWKQAIMANNAECRQLIVSKTAID